MSATPRHACPCCRMLTLAARPTGTFEICPMCRWEDDNLKYHDVDYAGGANRVSLRRANDPDGRAVRRAKRLASRACASTSEG